MAITLKRQLTPDEKAIILQRHGRVCFATGHAIPEQDSLHYDHIRAFALGGRSELDNIAPMCETHNKAKGMLPLEDFRISLQLQDFFKTGDRLTLKDLLQFLKSRGQVPSFGAHSTLTQADGKAKLDSAHGSFTNNLLSCPTTSWKYFYATLPVELIDSDDDEDHQFGLQPRFLIFDKVFGLFRHFQNHPVLQPSIGRFSNGKVLLFDGQHKAAALLWVGRRQFECKIYIDPDLRVLNQTNISAHDTFAQTRFFASVIRLERIYSSKSVMAWCEIFKDAVCAKLEITDEEDRNRPFYRELSDSDWEKINKMASRLLTWTQSGTRFSKGRVVSA